MTEEMQKQMSTLQSEYFDVFVEGTGEFQSALDDVVATVYADMGDMDGSLSTSQEAIQDFADTWGLSWDDAEKIIAAAIENIGSSAESLTETMTKQMGTLESEYFSIFVENSEDFQNALDSVASTVYSDMADMDGNFSTSQQAIQDFADTWGLTWDEAEKIVGEAVGGMNDDLASVNATIEDELLDQAQANLEAFQDCAGGKVGSLGDDFTGVWDSLVSDTNDLIEAGLLGQAQDNIQAFAECVVGKQAKMVSDIDGYLEELQGQYDENTEKINELVAAGLDEEAALYEEQNNEILAKMQQLQAWKEQLIQKGVISIEFNVDSASQNAAQNAVNNLLNKSGASAAVTITTSGTQQAKTVLTTGGFTSAQGGKGVVTPFQEGGIVTRPTLALIGEHGPEAVVPLGGGTTPEAFGVGAKPIQISIDFHDNDISGELDKRELMQDVGFRLVNELRRQGLVA
jgi:hypothetical protein